MWRGKKSGSIELITIWNLGQCFQNAKVHYSKVLKCISILLKYGNVVKEQIVI
jgi:hypothetical protein